MKGTADGEEFTHFVSRNREGLVHRYARYVDGNYADAEDLVQEGLIDLARQWPEVDTPKAWMHRHCERGAARVINRHQHPVRGALALDQDYAESLPADGRNPAADSDAYILAQELVSSPLEWAMLKLHADGYTHAEIAEAVKDHPVWARRRMGCTTSNVGKVLRREKERLSREIGYRLRTRAKGSTDNRELIMTAVLTLPRKQREAFGFRLAGFEPFMIARTMGTKPMNARANLSHANRKLAHAFGLDPDDATAVPRFVIRNLSASSLCLVLGAALARHDDLPDLVGLSSEARDLRGSVNATVVVCAIMVGSFMMREKFGLKWISVLTDEYMIDNVARALTSQIVRQLNVRDEDGKSAVKLTIPLPPELKPQ